MDDRINQSLNSLKKSFFRSKFELSQKNRDYITAKGLETIKEHAYQFINSGVLKIAGMDDFHYHDLRHTFCSNLILSGSDLKEVKDMIGHKDLSTTDRYSHLTAVHKKQNQERLAEHYAQ
jgi:site-specific recombinase XerD